VNTYPFVTVDVFTTQRFGGNPLAVVLDAEGLTTAQMQALAAEFNYSETTFVLPPAGRSHTAHVRIFNRRNEMDFAGHPNVGTALVLATLRSDACFTFEERAGLVTIDVDRDANGRAVAAHVQAPQALTVVDTLPVDGVAACLGLEVTGLRTDLHAPVIASVGARFALVAVRPEALDRIVARPEAFAALAARFPSQGGRMSIFVYCESVESDSRSNVPREDVRDGPSSVRPMHAVIDARMFAPLDGTAEDPATGSAAAALAAFRLSLTRDLELRLRIRQGVRMGRPSTIDARAWRAEGIRASVRGGAVEVFRGSVTL
jgi:trans-2,3-dihydro-3-hydroxyanthranilate isomerase